MQNTDGAAAGTGNVVVSGGTLIDVRSGEQIENSAILVRDGRIERVGRAGAIDIPPGATVLDARGRWIVPGLIDAHAHVTGGPLTMELLPSYLAHGVTTIRDTGGNLTQLRLLRDEIEAGTRLGPRLLFAGPILDGIPPLWPMGSILIDTPQRAASAVHFLADQGVDVIKIYNSVREAAVQAVVETAHARGLPVTGHVPRTITTTRAMELGMDCLEHIRITGREVLPLDEANELDFLPLPRREPLLWQRYDLQSPPIQRLVERLAATQVFLDPTLTVDEALFAGGFDEQSREPDSVGLPQAVHQRVMQEPLPPLYTVPAELKQAARDSFAKRQAFVGMCDRAGVRLIAGTDTTRPGKYLPGRGLLNELELLVQSGLSPLAALRAATLTAAAALRREDEIGAVEAGRLADLVVLDADPLAGIRNIRSVHRVMQGGRLFEPSALLAACGDGSAAEAMATLP